MMATGSTAPVNAGGRGGQKPQAMFAGPARLVRGATSVSTRADLPGPGMYNVGSDKASSASAVRQRKRATPAFRSGVDRFGKSVAARGARATRARSAASRPGAALGAAPDPAAADAAAAAAYADDGGFAVPAVGSYDVAYADEALQRQGGGAPAAAFATTTQRGNFFVAKGATPGPGMYEAKPAESDRARSSNQSSMFSNVGQDRWGEAYEPKVAAEERPGPGWYTVEAAQQAVSQDPRTYAGASVLGSASSAFRSTSTRLGGSRRQQMGRAPGPAFYKPEPMQKKTFMLNTGGKWV